MIVDVTNEVYTTIKNTLVGVTVLSAYPSTTPIFPCVIVEEISNITDLDTVDTSGEHYSNVSIEINILSNSQNKISEVKGLRGQIDDIMSGQYRMNRGFAGVTPNFIDSSIYRYTMRYSFKVDSNKTIYRR